MCDSQAMAYVLPSLACFTPRMASAPCCRQRSGGESVSRRVLLKIAVAACTAATVPFKPGQAEAGTSVSGRQLVNGVLSGYGFPVLKDVDGFTPLLEQFSNLVIEFQYPSDWIVARNVLPAQEDSAVIAASTAKLSFGSSTSPMEGRSSGLTAGDYRKAEGVAFFVSGDLPKGTKTVADLPPSFILDLITPGDATGSASQYTLTKESVSPQTGYRTMYSKYESTTVSGYTVERRSIATAIVLGDGKLYVLSGTCSANRYKTIGDKLEKSVGSFHVYRL